MTIKKHHLPVVLFDGVCNLCHQSVKICLKYENPDLEEKLSFASLDSNFSKQMIAKNILSKDIGGSVVFINAEGTVFTKSRAVFQIAKFLRQPYSKLSYLQVFPEGLTDFFYAIVARYRYSLFGEIKANTPLTPEKHLSERFLD